MIIIEIPIIAIIKMIVITIIISVAISRHLKPVDRVALAKGGFSSTLRLDGLSSLCTYVDRYT